MTELLQVTDAATQVPPELQAFLEGVLVDSIFQGISRVGSPVATRGMAAFRRTFARASEKTMEEPDAPFQVPKVLGAIAEERDEAINARLGEEIASLWLTSDPQETETLIADAVFRWGRERKPHDGSDPEVLSGDITKALASILRNLRETVYRELFAHHYMQVASVDRGDRSQVEGVFVILQAEREKPRDNNLEANKAGEDRPLRRDLDFRFHKLPEIEAELQRTGNFVILGEPGSGKSTLLRYLAAVCAANGRDYLPLFMNLRDYGTHDVGLIADHARKFAEVELQLVMPDGFFEQALSTGRCLVCLDALDEVTTDALHQVVRNIEALARRYPGNRFIVTSRTAGFGDAPLDAKDFPHFNVQPMQDDDIDRFIALQLKEDETHAEELRQMLNRNPAIKAFASNPLLLTIVNMIYRESSAATLPANRHAIYHRAVEAMTAAEPDDSPSTDSAQPHSPFYEYRLETLAAVAYHLHSTDRQTVGEATLLRIVARFLLQNPEIPVSGPYRARRESRAFILWAERRAGLLIQSRGGSREFAFRHPTFQEYLAAQHMHLTYFWSEPDAYWENIKDHIRDERWREVILFLLSTLDEEYCTTLTRAILRAGSETRSSFRRLPVGLSLAAGGLADQAQMDEGLQRDIVENLGSLIPRTHGVGDESFLFSFDGDRALRALVDIRHIPSVTMPILTSIASDTGVFIYHRVLSASALGQQGQLAQAIAVLDSIATDVSAFADAKIEAALALGDLGEKQVSIDVLTNIANQTGGWDYERIRAANYLYRLGESDTAIAALESMANQSGAGVPIRLEASRELDRCGANAKGIRALNGIADELENGASDMVHVARTLGDLGDRSRANAILMAIMEDPSTSTVILIRTAEALATIGWSSEAKNILITIGDDTASGSLRRIWAAESLAVMGEHEAAIAVPVAIMNASASDYRDRNRAERALGNIAQHASALPILIRIAQDPTTQEATKKQLTAALASREWTPGQ